MVFLLDRRSIDTLGPRGQAVSSYTWWSRTLGVTDVGDRESWGTTMESSRGFQGERQSASNLCPTVDSPWTVSLPWESTSGYFSFSHPKSWIAAVTGIFYYRRLSLTLGEKESKPLVPGLLFSHMWMMRRSQTLFS